MSESVLEMAIALDKVYVYSAGSCLCGSRRIPFDMKSPTHPASSLGSWMDLVPNADATNDLQITWSPSMERRRNAYLLHFPILRTKDMLSRILLRSTAFGRDGRGQYQGDGRVSRGESKCVGGSRSPLSAFSKYFYRR